MTKILLEKYWEYTLTEYSDGYLFLEVICGRIGVFNVGFFLNKKELKAFDTDGADFIQSLANKVVFSPHKYKERHEESQELLKIIQTK